MKWTVVLVGLAVLVAAPAASAQEYVIKIKHAGLGDKAEVKHGDNSTMDFKVLDSNGGVLQDKKETKVHKFHFRETGLERAAADDDLVKLKRHYEHAERIVDGMRMTLPYQGKTLLIAKKDGRFQFQIDGDEIIDGKEAEELNEEFNKGDFRKLFIAPFLPTKAVKVDETWKFDVAGMAKDFGKDGNIDIDVDKSKGSGKLLKVYQKNGKQFGVVELTMEFPVANWISEGNKSPAKDSKITIRLQRDGCIDGSVDQTLTTVSFDGDIRADINANGMDVGLSIVVRSSGEESRIPLAK